MGRYLNKARNGGGVNVNRVKLRVNDGTNHPVQTSISPDRHRDWYPPLYTLDGDVWLDENGQVIAD